MPAAAIPPIEHVWRATQMAAWRARVTPTGNAELDRELPNGGWPASTLIELLAQQHGIGEMRLLRPALQAIAKQRRVALVQPPHVPQVTTWTGWGLSLDKLLLVKPTKTADALWTAEQILRNGSCGAVMFWQQQARPEALRRLHLAAQASDIVFWIIRPLVSAQDASPAPLRLGLRPCPAGIAIDIVKRRGPSMDEIVMVRFDDEAFLPQLKAPLPSGIRPQAEPITAPDRLAIPSTV